MASHFQVFSASMVRTKLESRVLSTRPVVSAGRFPSSCRNIITVVIRIPRLAPLPDIPCVHQRVTDSFALIGGTQIIYEPIIPNVLILVNESGCLWFRCICSVRPRRLKDEGCISSEKCFFTTSQKLSKCNFLNKQKEMETVKWFHATIQLECFQQLHRSHRTTYLGCGSRAEAVDGILVHIRCSVRIYSFQSLQRSISVHISVVTLIVLERRLF